MTLRDNLIRMASELPKGSDTRREILALLKSALQKMDYGHKQRHGSFFLTAFAIPREQQMEFLRELNKEMVKKSKQYYGFEVRSRQSRDDDGVFLVWWDYDWRKARSVWGEDPDYGEDSVDPDHIWTLMSMTDEAVRKVAPKFGLKPHLLSHSGNVKSPR